MSLAQARTAVYRLGRPLEAARWRVAFEGASALEVVDLLAAYQNTDGGFGHGIEPDFWNPASTPIQAWAAMEILREVGFGDPQHPVVRGLLGWLEDQLAAATGLPTAVPSNNDHPHAPWWTFDPHSAQGNHSEWNPQAALAGWAWAHAPAGSRLEALAAPVLVRAAEAFALQAADLDPHVTACFVTLASELRAAGRPAPIDLGALEAQLAAAADRLIEPSPDRWFTEYCCRPSQLVHSPLEPWSASTLALARTEADRLPDHQLADGTWAVTWGWGAYPEAWPVAQTWWKGILALQNARFLQAFAGEKASKQS